MDVPVGTVLCVVLSIPLPVLQNPLTSQEWEQGRCTKCGEQLEGRTRVLGQCVTIGAVAAALGTIPMAGVVGYLYQFPIPFAGVASGSDAVASAMVAAIFYSVLGGSLVQAAAGGLAGALAYTAGSLANVCEPRGAGPVYALAGVFGVVSALPGVLFVAGLVGGWIAAACPGLLLVWALLALFGSLFRVRESPVPAATAPADAWPAPIAAFQLDRTPCPPQIPRTRGGGMQPGSPGFSPPAKETDLALSNELVGLNRRQPTLASLFAQITR